MFKPGDVVSHRIEKRYGKCVIISISQTRPNGTQAAREYFWISTLNPAYSMNPEYKWFAGVGKSNLISEDIPF